MRDPGRIPVHETISSSQNESDHTSLVRLRVATVLKNSLTIVYDHLLVVNEQPWPPTCMALKEYIINGHTQWLFIHNE